MYEYILLYWFRRERSKYFKILLNLFVLEAARKEKVIISMIPERRKGSQQPIVLIQIRKICAIFARQLRRQNFPQVRDIDSKHHNKRIRGSHFRSDQTPLSENTRGQI
jgi:hypothetical protein